LDCKIIFSENDFSQKDSWTKTITRNIDYIFHLAASEGHGKDISMNSKSVLYMLETCVEKKCFPKIIFLSSTNLFGNTDCALVNEKTHSHPISEFSIHKLLAENYLKYYHDRFNIKSIILRIPNIYGPVAKKENFERVVLNRVIRSAYKKREITLFNNMHCQRDYIYIDDLLNALYLSGLVSDEFCNGKFYVIGPIKSYTIEKIWEFIQNNVQNTKIKLNLKFGLEPMEYRNFTGDSKEFIKISGWIPKISISHGIMLTLKHME